MERNDAGAKMKHNTTMIISGLITYSFGLIIGHLCKDIYILLFQPVVFMVGCIVGAIVSRLRKFK